MSKVKKIGQMIFQHLPWKVKYVISIYRNKNVLPRLINPRNYSEFIFRDNLLGRHNQHAYLADKYAVREYVEKKGLGKLLTKLYGVWDNANDIDFDALPAGFVLKCNHSCGMNIVCRDKDGMDKNKANETLNKWLSVEHPIRYEQHYRYIKHRIICEELIPNDKDGFFPVDYKIHCANGHPVFIQCCFERDENDVGRRVIYDLDWNNLHYVLNDSHYSDAEIPKPKHLAEMLEYASILSDGLEYARIDLYDTEDRVIFGEITLTPMGGWLDYFSNEALEVMGDAIRKYNKK